MLAGQVLRLSVFVSLPFLHLPTVERNVLKLAPHILTN